MYKALLQNDLLQDPDEGVNYFKNTLKKYFLKGATNVYLYRLLSFFNHRRQNQEFLIFTSKFKNPSHEIEGSMDGLDASFHGTVPIISTVQEQLLDISKQPVFEHRLQSCSMRMIQQSSDSISRECRTDSGTHFPSGIISLLIMQSEFSDQQRERLTSAMSLRNISLENYSYEEDALPRTLHHDQDIHSRSIHPTSRRQPKQHILHHRTR